MSARYSINDAFIIHEVIDGEVIMINLESGNYYTMNDAGAFIWQMIGHHYDVPHMTATAAQQFGVKPADMEEQVKRFIDTLSRENLVVPCAQAPVANGHALTAPAGAAYAPPELMVFKDMQDLLLLDPIHEITEKGWPYNSRKN